MARGCIVGVAVVAATVWFIDLDVKHPAWILVFSILGSGVMATLGVIAGIQTEKIDQLSAIQSFVILPLTFLSGTFYSVADLPDAFGVAAHLNPFFYMIDGFRYGMTGHADGSLIAGVWVLIGANVALAVACHRIVAAGWRLKA